MKQTLAAIWAWLRVQLFRLWTALAGNLRLPLATQSRISHLVERSIDALIEGGSSQLPYPWGDRIKSTIGNFGIWVQLTLAILIFRAAIGILLIFIRMMRRH